MVFSSIPFLFYFLPICLLLYYLVPYRFKNGVLLLFSLLFYAWGEPVYILLLILETLFDYGNGLCMEKFGTTRGKRTFFLCCSLVVELSVLFFFKYADFAINSINQLFGTDLQPPGIALPLGISFFTFQTMSYIVDLYRGEVKVERNYLNYLTYVSMFPQLIAGPIVRYSTIMEELHHRTIRLTAVSHGTLRFMQGLFKKTLIANQIGLLWEEISHTAPAELSMISAWIGALAVTLQIYFDFSGYSDMAIGMGEMLGFHFNENFLHPLAANSITDFWRKWHVSLSTWFRDYVYIPLGGNRVGKWKHIRNIMVVWMLTGLWHGAAWNFVCWGLYYGILLLFEKQLLKRLLDRLPAWVRHLYTLALVSFGFVIFSFDDFVLMKKYIGVMFAGSHKLIGTDILWYLQNYGSILVIAFVLAFPVIPKLQEKCKGKVWSVLTGAAYVILFLLSVASMVSDSYNPFLYFRF